MLSKNNIILNIDNVSHHYLEPNGQRFNTLTDATCHVHRGEFISFIGPSGCGKSTILRIIADLIKPSKGTVEKHFSTPGFVFQNFALFPWLTVYENIEFGLTMRGVPQAERTKIVTEKIHDVGLVGFEHKHPKELSGGMRQRVGIARALAINPDILLMDEPFSSLDAFTADKLKTDIMAIWKKYGMSIIMVTHLINDAIEMSDRIAVFSARPGTIKKTLTVNLTKPVNSRSPEFYELADKLASLIEHQDPSSVK